MILNKESQKANSGGGPKMQRPSSYQQEGKSLLQLVSPSSLLPRNPHSIDNGKIPWGGIEIRRPVPGEKM